MHELTQDQVDQVSGANESDVNNLAAFTTLGAFGGAALSGPMAPVGFVVGGVLGFAAGLVYTGVTEHNWA